MIILCITYSDPICPTRAQLTGHKTEASENKGRETDWPAKLIKSNVDEKRWGRVSTKL